MTYLNALGKFITILDGSDKHQQWDEVRSDVTNEIQHHRHQTENDAELQRHFIFWIKPGIKSSINRKLGIMLTNVSAKPTIVNLARKIKVGNLQTQAYLENSHQNDAYDLVCVCL